MQPASVRIFWTPVRRNQKRMKSWLFNDFYNNKWRQKRIRAAKKMTSISTFIVPLPWYELKSDETITTGYLPAPVVANTN